MSASASLPEIVGTAAAIAAIGGAMLGLFRGAVAWYRRTVGSRRVLAERLNQLAAGVTTRWVEERLGPPTFVGEIQIPPEQEIDSAPTSTSILRELVYRTKHAWIQVLVNEYDTVARFSVTVTDARFRFPVRDLTFYQLDAKLGHSRFSNVQSWSEPDGRSLRIAARRREYAESYWFGNPGNYQRYVLSHNDAGFGAFEFNIEMLGGPGWYQEGVLKFDDEPPVAQSSFDMEAPYARRFRAGTTVNTLTVLGPGMPPTGLVAPRGPDADHVRGLVPNARDRRRLRRRVRQANRQVEREIAQQAGTNMTSTSEEGAHGGTTP